MSSEDIFDPDSIGLTQGSEPQSQLTTGSEYEASGTSSSCPSSHDVKILFCSQNISSGTCRIVQVAMSRLFTLVFVNKDLLWRKVSYGPFSRFATFSVVTQQLMMIMYLFALLGL